MLNQERDTKTFRRFIKKTLFWYLFPNIIFNSCIPYLTFRSMDTVYLFEGKNCLARFLLPMALLLPFIITYDILKKTIIFSKRENIGFALPEHATKNKFMFMMAGINGISTMSFFLIAMLCVQLSIPDHSFNGTSLSIILGLIAGSLSVIFTLLPIKKFRSGAKNESLTEM